MNWRWLWYEFLYYPAAFLAFWLFSFRIRGRKRMPATGGVLIVANHQCAIDPLLVGIAVRRHIRYVARKTLFKPTWVASFLESLGAFPLNQESGGAEGLKATLGLLKTGEGVVVFPEGARTEDGAIHPFKPGIALLMRRAAAPILPVGIAGAYEAWPIWRWVPRAFCPLFLPAGKGGIAVVVGKPIDPEFLTRLPKEEMLERLRDIIGGLRAEAEQLRRRSIKA